MAGLTLAVLGPPDLSSGGVAVPLPAKSLALVIYLAMTGKRARREALADMFWGDTGEDGARANLRLALSKLRQSLPGLLDADADSVGLVPGGSLDVDALHLLQTVDTLLQQPIAAQEAAIARYRGPFLDEFTLRDCAAFEDWVAAERQRIDRRAIVLLRELVQAARRAGKADCEREYLALWARIEPWSEEVQLPLIQLQAQAGLMAAALDSFEACRRALAEELGARPSVALALLAEQVRRGELGLQVPPAQDAQVLPVPPAPQPVLWQPDDTARLYGRAADLRAVGEQMSQGERLVMLLGPAGVGKSHLARTIAQRAAPHYPDGQVACSFDFMDSGLSQEASQDHFVGVLGSALGLDLTQTAQPMAMLKTHLAMRRAIVCLDGFEACEAAAPAVSQVLAAAPHCLILVTSRTRLAITDGWTHELRGLGDEGSEAGKDPAIDLLLDCAERAGVTWGEGRDPLQLTRLVRLLDGSPLAIQFAAQSLRLLTPAQLVEKLEKGGWPDSSLHVAGYRYSTLQDVMDDVWTQLTPQLQEAWARCALFKGTFSLEWGQDCAGITQAHIASLVNRSILGLEPGRRLRMHELTRQYGLSMLAGMPRAQEHRRTFARAALARLVEASPALIREDAAVLDFIKPEINTLACAFDLALEWESPQDIHAPLEALWRAYHRLGWHHAAVPLLEAVLVRHAQADLAWRIPWHYMAGEATRSLYGFQRAGAHFKTAVTLGGVRLPRSRAQAWLVISTVLARAAVARPLALAQERNTQRVLTHAITQMLPPRHLNGLPLLALYASLGIAWLASRRSGHADARLTVLLKAFMFLRTDLHPAVPAWLLRRIRTHMKDVNPVQEAFALKDLGVAMISRGQWDDATSCLNRAAHALGALGYSYYALECLSERHSAQLHKGEFLTMLQEVQLSEWQARQMNHPSILRWSYLLRFQIGLRAGAMTLQDAHTCLASIHAIGAYRSPVEELSVYGHEALYACLCGDAVQVLQHGQHVLALSLRIAPGRFHALSTLQLTVDAVLCLALNPATRTPQGCELALGLVSSFLAMSLHMAIFAPRRLLYSGAAAALQGQWANATSAWTEGLALCADGVLRYDAARMNWMLSLYTSGEAATLHGQAAARDFEACGVAFPYPLMPRERLAR